MSRCFPFQATGYSNDALIVSIKLQEEREKSIPDRVTEKVKSSDKKKDRKKEKSEKKKDRRDKKRHEKEISFPDSVNQKHNDKLNKVDDLENESKGKLSLEVLERSNLTEEHGRPAAVQNVSCSSDSTGNSGKRKRNSSPRASSIQGHGNVIRIRLSSQKRVDPSTSQGNARPLFRSDSTVSQADVMSKAQVSKVQEPLRTPSTSTAALKLVSPVDNKVEPLPQEEPSTSGRVESREQPPKKLSSHERKLLKNESAYNKLFQNLLPPMLNTELLALQEDEDDWLFGKKDEVRPPKKLRESSDDLTCSISSVLQPRSCFLSDVGVYALPFTVPF